MPRHGPSTYPSAPGGSSRTCSLEPSTEVSSILGSWQTYTASCSAPLNPSACSSMAVQLSFSHRSGPVWWLQGRLPWKTPPTPPLSAALLGCIFHALLLRGVRFPPRPVWTSRRRTPLPVSPTEDL